MNNTNVLNI